MSSPGAGLLGGLEPWVEEERGTLNVVLQSAAQPRRCALRERREALEPASRLKVRAGGAWTPGREGMLEAPLQWLSFEQSSSPELDLSPAAPGHLPPFVSRLGGGCTSSTLLCLLVLCAQETPDPWQGLDPFDSLDSKPFRKGNWGRGTAPGHPGLGSPGLSGGWGSRARGHGDLPWATVVLRDRLCAPR